MWGRSQQGAGPQGQRRRGAGTRGTSGDTAQPFEPAGLFTPQQRGHGDRVPASPRPSVLPPCVPPHPLPRPQRRWSRPGSSHREGEVPASPGTPVPSRACVPPSPMWPLRRRLSWQGSLRPEGAVTVAVSWLRSVSPMSRGMSAEAPTFRWDRRRLSSPAGTGVSGEGTPKMPGTHPQDGPKTPGDFGSAAGSPQDRPQHLGVPPSPYR